MGSACTAGYKFEVTTTSTPAMKILDSTFAQHAAALMRSGVYLVAILLVCWNYWINRYFGMPDIDQISYHLQFGAEGLGASDPAVVRRFVRWCIVAPLLLLVCVLLAERWVLARGKWLSARLRAALPAAALIAAIALWLSQLSIMEFVAANAGPDYFGQHYVPPAQVAVQGINPKNLILIYVESLEAGYSDRAVFGDNLIAPLTDLDARSFAASHFDQFEQVPGTGWTIAAMVATQCGVPLKRITVFDETTQGDVVQAFLPNAVCLSDILARHGYRNVFMGGASPTFAGKGKFLRAHHYHEVLGREDWLRNGVPENAMNGWGLYDEDLFGRARVRLGELHAAGQPFNLTLLTVDSHEPFGHLSRSCARRGHAGFEGVIRCSAGDIAAFVEHVAARGYLLDTNIVILGDHLARRNPLSHKLARLPARSLFNAFIGVAVPARNRAQLVHFDLLPTILEFSGFTVEGGRLGLGYSAFNQHAVQPEPQRLSALRASVMNRSDSYRALWIAPRPP